MVASSSMPQIGQRDIIPHGGAWATHDSQRSNRDTTAVTAVATRGAKMVFLAFSASDKMTGFLSSPSRFFIGFEGVYGSEPAIIRLHGVQVAYSIESGRQSAYPKPKI
jgi:hypothetical protein